MNVEALARAEGVRVVHADLGNWGASQLRSEYDPDGPVIRVNRRWLDGLPGAERARATRLAVAHELYHHREATGAIARKRTRAHREAAADAFALALCESS